MNEQPNRNPTIKTDYQMNVEIASKIIEAIERGDVQEWRKAWTTTAGKESKAIYDLVVEGFAAVNVYTMKSYEFPFIVTVPGFYVTFKQIKDRKLKLAKGSKGTPNYKPAFFSKRLTSLEREALKKAMAEDEELRQAIDELKKGERQGVKASLKYVDSKGKKREFRETLEWDKRRKEIIYSRFQYVLEYLFKAEDCDIDVKKLWKIEEEKEENKETNDLKRIEKVENVKDSYIDRSKLKFSEIEQNQAYYRLDTHSVVVPEKKQFDTIENYYQTIFHEFAHSTGHPNLLNRKTLTAVCGFGSPTYSKEELVAELSSLYTMTALNIINDDLLKNSIAYLKGWGEGLKEGIKYNILNTIGQAQKATNLILGVE